VSGLERRGRPLAGYRQARAPTVGTALPVW